jgi:hypothetical protein
MNIAAFSPEAVRRHYLAGTKWAPLNIRDSAPAFARRYGHTAADGRDGQCSRGRHPDEHDL